MPSRGSWITPKHQEPVAPQAGAGAVVSSQKAPTKPPTTGCGVARPRPGTAAEPRRPANVQSKRVGSDSFCREDAP